MLKCVIPSYLGRVEDEGVWAGDLVGQTVDAEVELVANLEIIKKADFPLHLLL